MAAQVERFLYGGGLGLVGVFAALWLLHGQVRLPFAAVSLLAILFCAAIGFLFVEVSCREEERSQVTLGGRAALYFALNSIGIAIDWLLLIDLTRRGTGDYLLIAMLGAAVAVVWNYLLNLVLTWKL